MLKFHKIITRLSLLMILTISGCTSVTYDLQADYETLYGPSAVKNRELSMPQSTHREKHNKVLFYQDVKPILDSRCVACHGCYDAPCQLKMESFSGLDRGASKQKVYNSSRMRPSDPTRLFVDAADTQGWREKKFFPVLNERMDSAVANLDNSLLAKLIQLKRFNPLPETGKLDDSFTLSLKRQEACPTIDEFSSYQRKHAGWGMPYAMPGLSLEQEYTLMQWIQEGAKIGPQPALPNKTKRIVRQWETWLNRSSLKQQLVARYIYEHLFIGHLQFKGSNEFFQLIRSKTPSGQPIEEIATPRPFDDPGLSPFYYRFRHITETLVDKVHFVYQLSEQKMQRYEELFFAPDYPVTGLPSYQPELVSNPFRKFRALPMHSRYQFLLDDAEYFVSGFIKGPVCRGQVALNSIQDRFWVFFSTPSIEFRDDVTEFQAENNYVLGLPGQEGDNLGVFDFMDFDALGAQYMQLKDDFIGRIVSDGGLNLDLIWDGEGVNRNAALTIFRHFDSATVVKGFVGKTPLTGWFVDYPIFERLHYLLVAGFNVYGTAAHQIASRTYMDILRQDAENNFLRLLPAEKRQEIYDSWYVGIKGPRALDPLFNINLQSGVDYQTDNQKQELFELIMDKLGKAAGKGDTINRCLQRHCVDKGLTPELGQISEQMRILSQLSGLQLAKLPEVSLLRIKTKVPEKDPVYTLIVDKALSNVSVMIGEAYRRLPENDGLTVVPGFVGSYPNFFFSVEIQQLPEFIKLLQTAKEDPDLERLYSYFGIRRTNPQIWRNYDWFNQRHIDYREKSAGLLDLSRYQNY